MRASGGGTLVLSNDNFDNLNGVIEALAGSEVRLSNLAHVTGGLIQTIGDGVVVQQASTNVFLEDLTLDANVQVLQNTDFGLIGDIVNNGDINVTAGGDIEVDGLTELSGGGAITLNNARINGVNSAVLQVADQTIEGEGQIGINTLAFELSENTLVDANVADETLTVDGRADFNEGFGVINDGTMRASDGGTLVLSNDNFDNLNGVIEALAGSEVRLSNLASITGGLIQTIGDGVVVQQASTNVFLEDLTLDANVQVLQNCDFGIAGTVTNDGSISLSPNIGTDIELQAGGTRLLGSGTITLAGNGNRIVGTGSPGSSTIGGSLTIQGFGQIGANTAALRIFRDTTISANVPDGVLTLDGNNTLNTAANFGLELDGLLEAVKGGVLRFSNDIINARDAEIVAREDSVVEIANLADICGGTFNTEDNGQILVTPSSNVFFRSNLPILPLFLNGEINVMSNTDLGIEGPINHSGTINIDLVSDIEIQSLGASLIGPGTVNLSNDRSRINGFAPLTIDGGTLTGIGSVNVDTTFEDATLSAGNADAPIGTLEFVNSDSAWVGTTIGHEIQSVVDNPGVTADVIDVAGGTLNLEGVTIKVVSLGGNGQPGSVADFDPNVDYEFVVAIADEITNVGGLVVDSTEFANELSGSLIANVVQRGNSEALVVQTSDLILGDVNRDGNVNFLDIQPFIEALASQEFQAEADIDQNGVVNFLDISPFIGLLSAG